MTHLILGPISVNQLFAYQQKYNSHSIGVAVAEEQSANEVALYGAKVFKIDFKENIYNQDIYSYILKYKPIILTHHETWGAFVKNYTDIFAVLTGRTVQSLEYHLKDLGVDVKISTQVSTPSNRMLNIKDVLPIIQNKNLPIEQKMILSILGELIR